MRKNEGRCDLGCCVTRGPVAVPVAALMRDPLALHFEFTPEPQAGCGLKSSGKREEVLRRAPVVTSDVSKEKYAKVKHVLTIKPFCCHDIPGYDTFSRYF